MTPQHTHIRDTVHTAWESFGWKAAWYNLRLVTNTGLRSLPEHNGNRFQRPQRRKVLLLFITRGALMSHSTLCTIQADVPAFRMTWFVWLNRWSSKLKQPSRICERDFGGVRSPLPYCAPGSVFIEPDVFILVFHFAFSHRQIFPLFYLAYFKWFINRTE